MAGSDWNHITRTKQDCSGSCIRKASKVRKRWVCYTSPLTRFGRIKPLVTYLPITFHCFKKLKFSSLRAFVGLDSDHFCCHGNLFSYLIIAWPCPCLINFSTFIQSSLHVFAGINLSGTKDIQIYPWQILANFWESMGLKHGFSSITGIKGFWRTPRVRKWTDSSILDLFLFSPFSL